MRNINPTALWLQSKKITKLDPIGFSRQMLILHLMDQADDVREIVQLLYSSLPSPDTLELYSYEESVATMRDLGFFIGTLKKHGIEPVDAVPELEYVLLVLMVKTQLPPRDTLLHYTLWNPDNTLMRTYTQLPDEKGLIRSVQIAIRDLIEAILDLEKLHNMDVNRADFTELCYEVRLKIQGMVDGIVLAKKNVSPAIFYNVLRFYFDPIRVDYSNSYMGPGAVEMPMFVFDHLLWSSDVREESYTRFKETYLPYNLSFIRDIYWDFKERPSLLSQVESILQRNPAKEVIEAAKVLLDICMTLKSFRMPHKRLAEQAYQSSDRNNNHHQTGSGGYSTEILNCIIDLQNDRIKNFRVALRESSTSISL